MRYSFNADKHIHLLDGKPLIGTSTAVKVLGKPLTWWASGLAVGKLGWTNSKVKVDGKYETVPDSKRLPIAEASLQKLQGLPTKDYLALLDDAYRAHADRLTEAATGGTDLHASLEAYVKGCIEKFNGEPVEWVLGLWDIEGDERLASFSKWALQNVRRFLWSEKHCFSEELWLGGIIDAGAELKDGRKVIIDFKSAKEAYLDHWLQIALYRIQYNENGLFDADGNAILDDHYIDGFCVVPFGGKTVEPQFLWDIEGAERAAEALLTVYKYSQKFQS